MAQPNMPELYDQLVERTAAWSEQNPTRPERYELSSERVLSGSDERSRVTVTMQDFAVTSVRLDPAWYATAEMEAVEEAVTAAVNATLKAYLDAELSEAAQAAPADMATVHQELLGFSGEFHAAFDRAMGDLTERMRRA